MSYTGEIRMNRSAALRGLGSVGLLADALVVGSFVTAALAVTAAAKLVTAPASIIRNAVRNAKVNGIANELADAAESADRISAELDEKMRGASEACREGYDEAVKRLKETYDRDHDYAAFMTACAEAREKLYRDISEKRRAIESGYIAQLNSAVSESRNEMEISRREIGDSVQRISDAEEKKKKAAEAAERVLSGTEALLGAMKRENGGEYCGRLISECLDMCAAARAHLNNGMYEAALADAFSARNTALLRISDIMKRDAENRQRHSDVSALLTAMEELLDSGRKAEFVFDKTRSGEPVDVQTDDFTVYYRGRFEELEGSLNGIRSRFESRPDHLDFGYAELDDMISELNRWQDSFLKETGTAYERLENTMIRCETADLLMDKYEDEGYDILPLSEEEEQASMLDTIIIRMEHRETGETLCLRLNSEPDADGHIGMVIGIEDHTRYKGSGGEVENARENTRRSVCSAISDSNIGKDMQLRQRCTNPGVRDE